MSNTRKQHVEWCKRRALEYVNAGLLDQAIVSMSSDMGKRDDTRVPGELIVIGMMDIVRGRDAVRHWIEEFD